MNIALRSCKASAENIARILRPHSLALDAEFLVVAETVDQTLKSASCLPQLETFAASDPKSLVLRFAELLARQLEHLERLQRDQNAFLSCLQSPRLNHAILGRSTLIFQALCNIVDAANMIRPIEDNKLGECTPKVVLALSSVPGIALSNTAHTAPEDPKAQLFWTQNWSAERYFVPWQQFQSALATQFPNACLRSFSSLQYLLDFSSTGEVSNTRFRSLVNLAPSFERFVAWGAALCAQPWFVGFLNKNEATMLLQQEPQGTFLVRMHKTVRGALVISYVSHARGILHHIVQRDKIGFSMLNCEGAWPTLEELIEHSHFLASPYASKHLPVELIRSHYFLGEAGRENAEALFEGLAPGVFAVRLQPLAFVPPSTLLSNSSLYKNTPNSTSSPPAPSNDLNESSNSTQSPHNSNSTRSPASAHPQSSPASTTHSNSPSLVPIECPTSPAITSSPVSGFKDVCIILSTMAGNGLVRHTYVLRDFEERIFVAGKPYETLATYLEAHKSNFVVPFSPSISRFKTQLDTSHLMPVMNPSPVASRPLSSRRNSSRLGASNSSLSSSAGAHLTRSKNESDTTDDSEDSPYHNINYKNCGGNRPSPNVSHDDLIIPVRCESPSYSDDLPVFEMTGISLMPGSALGGIFGKTAARRSIVSGERTSGSSTLSHSSILGPDTTPLSLSETTASGLGAFSQFETGSRHSSSLLHGNDLAASSAVVPNHVSMVGTSCTGGSFGSGLGTGSHLPSTPSRASIAASSAAIIAPSSYSRRDGVYYTNAALDAAEIPRTKPAWKPLTDQQVNPHLLTYRDMWAELLRYYHVPVPEAKLKPKQNSLHSSSGASHATKSSSSSSSHQKSSKRR